MTLFQTVGFAAIAIFIGLVTRERFRAAFLLILSLLAVFLLQPSLPIRYLDFWLPTATLVLATLGWVLTAPPEQRALRANWRTAILLTGVISALGLLRFLPFDFGLVVIHPPQIWQILIVIGLVFALAILLSRFWRPSFLAGFFVITVILLVILKSLFMSGEMSAVLRGLSGQSVERASAIDIRWLGFSYIAFRLIHTVRDRQAGLLASFSLAEYLTYIVFFPSLIAGPIDRVERFVADLRRPLALTEEDWIYAGKRFFVGLFKKFVIADGLAIIALNNINASQVQHTFWAWIMLYSFALQIFFDFSGYTDIVIGVAKLMGIKLPENFNYPYLKPNLTQFWNNWHMTLTQWFRSYYFNPVNRWLRGRKNPPSVTLQIFIMQVSTMLLIGLWHGISWNFVAWGLWHGLGLFIHNRWSDYIKPKTPTWTNTLAKQRLLNIGGIFLTFNFVAVGWIFFALPALAISRQFLLVLLGLR
jgi:alginate O-acetyltransferase complex protein AlgI